MNVTYPPEFSNQSRAAVHSEIIEGGREFQKQLSAARGTGTAEDLLIDYILRVLVSFARETAKLALSDGPGRWAVDRVDRTCDEFLRSFTINTYYERGSGLPRPTESMGGLRSEIERAFRRSSKWKEYEDIVLAVTRAHTECLPSELPEQAVPSKAALGSQIRALREECRMTLEELADAVRVSARNVRRHEDGTTKHLRPGNLKEYEKVFTARLKRPIRLIVP
jgi:hypothetical protein